MLKYDLVLCFLSKGSQKSFKTTAKRNATEILNLFIESFMCALPDMVFQISQMKQCLRNCLSKIAVNIALNTIKNGYKLSKLVQWCVYYQMLVTIPVHLCLSNNLFKMDVICRF